jgi:hypothetical protein
LLCRNILALRRALDVEFAGLFQELLRHCNGILKVNFAGINARPWHKKFSRPSL